MRPARRAAVLVLLSAGVLGHGPRALACSCDPLPTKTKAMFRAADAVFVGTVAGLVPVPPVGSALQATVYVSDVYKGDVPASVAVRTPGNLDDCGVEFVVGTRYAIFAESKGAALETGFCHGTDKDVASLARAGYSPRKVHASASPTLQARPRGRAARDGRSGAVAAALLLLAAAAAGSLVARRRRRTGGR